MPIYHSLGQIPRKRHIAFRRPDGGLYAEELMGHEGFTGTSSLLYHVHQPTPVQAVRKMRDLAWQRDPEREFRHRHFRTHQLGSGGSLALDRIPLLFNGDVAMSFVQPTRADDFFYRNAQGDEVVYVSQGSGVLETPLGEIAFKSGDYLVIPRGILHRYRLADEPMKCLVIESTGLPACIQLAFEVVADEGTVLQSGECEQPVEISPSDTFIRREVTYTGSWYYADEDYPEMRRPYEEGLPVARLVTDVFPAADVQAAYEKFVSKRSGKVLIDWT